jgi:hypothetical protein
MGGCGPDSMDGPYPCGQYNATLLYLKNGGRALHDALSYGNQVAASAAPEYAPRRRLLRARSAAGQWGTGAAVKDAPKLLNIKREDIFMMSMVPREMMGYDLTKKAVAASLAQLQVEHIDLVMFHHRAGE